MQNVCAGLTKSRIRQLIANSYMNHKPIAFDLKDLVFAFGFERMSGENVLLAKLITGKSETEVQTLPIYKVRENIELWCKEQNIKYYYDLEKDMYIFQ